MPPKKHSTTDRSSKSSDASSAVLIQRPEGTTSADQQEQPLELATNFFESDESELFKEGLNGMEHFSMPESTIAPAASQPFLGAPSREVAAAIARSKCAITRKVMFEPAFLPGYSQFRFEKEAIEGWLEKHDTIPGTNTKITDKTTILLDESKKDDIRTILVDGHPELWEQNEHNEEQIYFTKRLRNEMVDAVEAKDLHKVQDLLNQDPRLLTRPLTEEGHNLLRLACSSSKEILNTVIINLNGKIFTLPEFANKKEDELFDIAGTEIGTDGANLFVELLKWDHAKIQEKFKQALDGKNYKLATSCLGCGANINERNSLGLTPFLSAIVDSKQDIAEFLLSINPSLINDLDLDNNNALHLAAKNNNTEMAMFALEKGVKSNKEAVNKQNKRPIDLAKEAGYEQFVSDFENKRRELKRGPFIKALEKTVVDKDEEIRRLAANLTASTAELEELRKENEQQREEISRREASVERMRPKAEAFSPMRRRAEEVDAKDREIEELKAKLVQGTAALDELTNLKANIARIKNTPCSNTVRLNQFYSL